MAKIHVPKDGHVAPAQTGGYSFLPYTDDAKKRIVDQAIFILTLNVRGMKSCNECFQKLANGHGRTFDDILDDPMTFIHYDTHTGAGDFGATLEGTQNVTITEFAIRMGRWTVAATLVHEFAHVNGAPGTDSKAEETLKCCGFKDLYNPKIIGSAEPFADIINAEA
jgi:hypothetical protein